jgi:NAD(P)-dependent dehydrogenase (short-subunit alcohol dehydrogenase family)
MPEEDWDEIIDINLKSYYLCSQAVVKGMLGRRAGGIINLASIAGFRAGRSAYAVTKAGVVMLTRVLSQGLSEHGIRVNGIGPGVVKTDMTRGIFWRDSEESVSTEIISPARQMLGTDDVIGAALFLASDASRNITGHTIVIGGGDVG